MEGAQTAVGPLGGAHARDPRGARETVARHVLRGHRHRRGPGHRRRRQPRTHPERSRVRQTLRRVPAARIQRQDQQAQAQQGRQPAGQRGAAPHRHRPPAIPPTHQGLRRQEDPRGQRQARDHPLRQTVHRPRGVPGAHRHTQRRERTRDLGRTRRQAARTAHEPWHHPTAGRRGAMRAVQPHQRNRTR